MSLQKFFQGYPTKIEKKKYLQKHLSKLLVQNLWIFINIF